MAQQVATRPRDTGSPLSVFQNLRDGVSPTQGSKKGGLDVFQQLRAGESISPTAAHVGGVPLVPVEEIQRPREVRTPPPGFLEHQEEKLLREMLALEKSLQLPETSVNQQRLRDDGAPAATEQPYDQNEHESMRQWLLEIEHQLLLESENKSPELASQYHSSSTSGDQAKPNLDKIARFHGLLPAALADGQPMLKPKPANAGKNWEANQNKARRRRKQRVEQGQRAAADRQAPANQVQQVWPWEAGKK